VAAFVEKKTSFAERAIYLLIYKETNNEQVAMETNPSYRCIAQHRACDWRI